MIKQAGERATYEVGIHGLAPEMIKLLGRLRFRTSYGQNVLNHSIEVALLSGMIADELGVDSTLAKRAGLLHDIGKALTQEIEGSHVQLGVDIAKKFKESKEVIHAIEAHHNDVEPQTITAVIVQAADAISAARPGARRDGTSENYIKRLQKIEEITYSFPGVDKAYAIQAGREVRIAVKPEEVNDEQMVVIAHEIVKKLESELQYPGRDQGCPPYPREPGYRLREVKQIETQRFFIFYNFPTRRGPADQHIFYKDENISFELLIYTGETVMQMAVSFLHETGEAPDGVASA